MLFKTAEIMLQAQSKADLASMKLELLKVSLQRRLSELAESNWLRSSALQHEIGSGNAVQAGSHLTTGMINKALQQWSGQNRQAAITGTLHVRYEWFDECSCIFEI